ncbi:MAG TPA: leucyl aminopeptidase [Terriglobia bacterium]|nr:leucyl aminopeptidase [Terriglobia bacterium]
MDINFVTKTSAQVSSAALVAYGFEKSASSSGTAERLPAETRKLLAELEASGELSGRSYECTLTHRPPGLAAARLLVVGAGKKEKFSVAQLRRLAGTAVRYLRARGLHDLAWVLDGGKTDPDTLEAVVEGAILADYDADRYRTERDMERRIDRLDLVTGDATATGAWQGGVERGRVIAQAQNFARDLVNEPANRLTPVLLAQRATDMAAEFGLESEVLGPEEIRGLKMGAFLAVARGSEEPPRLIVLRYEDPHAVDAPLVALVGKGITFDTGGISIKPAADMHEMKTDMGGGAAMLGAMRAIAQLKPRARVMAIVPATENMPSGKAYKPGDVITSMSGKTIEILNTDAEGRLVLADALTYAKQQGAEVLIDAATLTGAVTVALGNITTGVFGWNKDWVGRVLASAQAVGERMWELPVDDDYRDLYKSAIADLANTGGRYGGAITAAMFVGEFAGDTPWVHLDIAGTRWSNEEKPYLAKGPTGHPVRTLVHLLTHLSE